jgi:NAD(P)-dependent dehydrogenase (short-subunit alcohol dehydrogenase family)
VTGSGAVYPDLEGKVALVTGGSKGIGAATCRLLAANGVRVAVNGRSQAGVDDLARRLDGAAIGITGDCTSEDEVETMRERVEAELGPVDLLVTFAGGFSSFTPVQNIALAEWRQVIDDNLTTTFLTVRAFLPGMIERGQGSIVTMASISARFLDKPTMAAYAAAKAGVVMFTRHLALEVGSYGVRANCVAPGTTRSERIERIMDREAIERTARMSPLGRLGDPQDTANAAVFLLSEAASWLTGVTLDVAGGRVML